MNGTIALIVGLVLVFAAVVIGVRHLIGENQRLKAENRNLKTELRNANGWYLAMRQRNAWLQSELGATEDAAEQEAER